MNHFTPAMGRELQRHAVPMIKRPNPVYMIEQHEPFTVETNEGPLTADAGDFLAYDPISGHVWPVAASYVAQHYTRKD